MKSLRYGLACGAIAALLSLPASLLAVDLTALLKAINNVGPLGENNVAAAEAWRELSQADASQLPQILAELNRANPLAANYLRSAAEAIAQRQLAAGKQLPTTALEAFVNEKQNEPRARHLAFELLVKVDDTARARLIPTMLHDESVELRRDAVALELASAAAASAKETQAKHYRAAFNAAVDDDQVKEAAEKLKAIGEKTDIAGHYGFITTWHLVGPFDNKDEQGYDKGQGPEGKPFELTAKFRSLDGKEIGWAEHTTGDEYGKVNLNEAVAKLKGATSYAVAFVDSSVARPVQLRLTTLNACKVWLNGKLVDEHQVYHSGSSLDQYVSQGELKPGKNVIMLKICQNEQTEDWAQDWAFQFRLSDRAGAAITSAK